jgi:polysaccharide pyruvyl transferase WcaK-like protein
MRLHALIFASIYHIPLVALAYQPKVTSFMKLLGQDKNILYPTHWTFESILSTVEDTWHNRDSISETISHHVADLQQLSTRNINLMQSILHQPNTSYE